MLLRKGQLPIFLTGIIAVILFTVLFISRKNYEFIIYIAVIIFFIVLILIANRKVNYPNYVLWWLVAWAIMHMAGGGLFIGEKKLYELMILDAVGEPYNIFKFDQLVHIVGFFTATLALYYPLKPYLKENHKWTAVSIVVVMAGLGAGAVNEIIEFTATVIVPETGVGGYENTSLDLVSDLIGAIIGLAYIRHREK